MSTRIPCINPECTNTILPATAAANQGLCAPCIGAIRQKEYDEYVRLNRKTVDLYEGITDPVEIIKIMLSRRKHDPLIVYAPAPASAEELFARLNEADANRLQKLAVGALEEGNEDLAENIAKYLATLTEHSLAEIQRAWTARNHYWPFIIFRSARPEIRDRIIQPLSTGQANANHALSALAWVDDDVVRSHFAQWDKKLPSWGSNLRIRPSEYSAVAGWTISKGDRRQLYHDVCYGITTATGNEATKSLELFQSAQQPCPWCSHELSHMVVVDLDDPQFAFLGMAGHRFPVLTCHGCTAYSDFFARLTEDGHAEVHPKSERPKWLPSTEKPWISPAWKGQSVALSRRRAVHATGRCMGSTNSQIGGHPTWEQHSAYPKCPDCSQFMRFVAQLDEGDFPRREGTYYAFVCEPCRVTATSYQQT